MKLYSTAVALILLAILLAQLVVPAPYEWTRNTISELAAQGYDKSWIMRLGFICFGALVLSGGAWKVVRNPRRNWPHGAISLYGLAILLSGIFSTSPFAVGTLYSEAEANLHSTMAVLAGIAISAAMLSCAIVDAPVKRKIMHLAALLLVLTLSALFGESGARAGIVQRALYVVGFAWLVYVEDHN